MTIYESAEKIMEFYAFATISKAKKMYPELSKFTINVKTNTGSCAGRAMWKFNTNVMDLFINVQMMLQSEEAFHDMIEDTIIHEVAHCVEYAIYREDAESGHGKVWRDIASSLGLQNPSRVHYNKVVFTSGNYQYNVYGKIVNFSLTRHNKMQKRNSTYLVNGIVVDKSMFIGVEEPKYIDYIPEKYKHILELLV